jgi:hypothetical protein
MATSWSARTSPDAGEEEEDERRRRRKEEEEEEEEKEVLFFLSMDAVRSFSSRSLTCGVNWHRCDKCIERRGSMKFNSN